MIGSEGDQRYELLVCGVLYVALVRGSSWSWPRPGNCSGSAGEEGLDAFVDRVSVVGDLLKEC
jgi:hypothetical protein